MNAAATQELHKAAGLFQAGRFDEALAASEAALRLAPEHPEGLHLKAMALGRLGRIDEAVVAFDQTAARHAQRHAVLGNKGNALRAAGRLEEAIAAYRESVKADARFVAGWAGLAAALRNAGKLEDAETAFKEVLSLNPKHATALNNYGLLLTQLNRHQEALDVFSRALKARPDMLTARINRGAAYRHLGDREKALEDHRAAATQAPSHADATYQYANSLRHLGSLKEAERAYMQALIANPMREDIHRDFAHMLWEIGETGRFLFYIDRALDQQASVGLAVLKSELAFAAGLMDVAADAAQRANDLDPQNSRALKMLGSLSRRHKDFHGALARFEAAAENAPHSVDAVHDLAEARLAVGDYAGAIELLPLPAPKPFLQRRIALRSLAMRLAGDDAYKYYCDYDRMVGKIRLNPPEGYETLEAFNDALVSAIRPLHSSSNRPIDQTLYGGTQSHGRLWDEPDLTLQALKKALLSAARDYVATLPNDSDHPFLSRKTSDLKYAGAWSVMLSDGGGHVDHYHPKGWVSAVYYVAVPPEVGADEKAGFLRFGAPAVAGVALPAERWVRPVPGEVVFFPSYIWHGVEPFRSQTERITAPFDLAVR